MHLKMKILIAFLLLVLCAPALQAQAAPGYVVIDGTQNPPKLVFSNINVAITDGGPGSYVLTFDDPVVFFSGTALSKGPAFDAADTVLTAVLDSTDEHKVNVKTRGISTSAATGHALADAQFSIEVHF
jgi:hypothetical protein